MTRGDAWRPIGFALHVQNGAVLGAAYARIKPSLPGPPIVRGLIAGLVEHVATWPMTALVDRYHPACDELPKLAANGRAFGQATIRHAVFGIVLGVLEDALNGTRLSQHQPLKRLERPRCRGRSSQIDRSRSGATRRRTAPITLDY